MVSFPLIVLLALSALVCLLGAGAVLLTRGLGVSAWPLALFLVGEGLAAGVLGLAGSGWVVGWSLHSGLLSAYFLLAISLPAAFAFARVHALGEEEPTWRSRVVPGAAALVAGIFCVAYFWRAVHGEFGIRRSVFLDLSTAGDVLGLYLLVVSVFTLAMLERTLRSAEEHVRWEIKFLLLGVALLLVVDVFLASQLLLYSRLRLLTFSLLGICPLPAAAAIVFSLRRISGKGRVKVSQGLTYSWITLGGVGIYLVSSSLLARWARSLLGGQVGTDLAIVFVLVLVLAVFLLSAQFRDRLRLWVRRNFFSGRHDYRASWLEATERIRPRIGSGGIAVALADLVQRAVGAIDVSVWRRDPESGLLRLDHARGPALAGGRPEGEEFVRGWQQREAAEILGGSQEDQEDIEGGAGREFRAGTRAELLVPLRSGSETLGVLAVGSDRSGEAYDEETREFLHVLATHAAGEYHKEELGDSLVKAREAEAFRTFATFLLHDLKNFATSLGMIAQNASKYGDNEEFRRDAFASVLSTASKMRELCNSLRTFSPGTDTRRKSADLERICREVVEGLSGSLRVEVRLELEGVPALSLDVDGVRSVLRNLLLNADEASDAGSAVVVQTRLVGERVELCVEDRGCGMPAEFMANELFRPFRTTKSSGLGIGLFQSKRVMEDHGGGIEVESECGRGTRVVLRFPVPIKRAESG